MTGQRDNQLSARLFELIGAEGCVVLANAFGGTRLYVPETPEGSVLEEGVGAEIALKLSREYGRSYLRVPLYRALRARALRIEGRSNGQIARALSITETAVNKIFQWRLWEREYKLPTEPKGARQLDLF